MPDFTFATRFHTPPATDLSILKPVVLVALHVQDMEMEFVVELTMVKFCGSTGDCPGAVTLAVLENAEAPMELKACTL